MAALDQRCHPRAAVVNKLEQECAKLVKQGVPAIFLVSGFNSSDPEIAGGELFGEFLNTHYHKPSDDLSRPVHWPSALKFARTNVQIGLQAANADQAPRWNEGNFFGERFAAGR